MVELVSIHIPKTAGRSFLAILKSNYNQDFVAHFDRKNYPENPNTAIDDFKAGITNQTQVIHGHFTFKDIADIKNVSFSKIITWFRNPVERVISNYHFFKKRIALSPGDSELQKRKYESLIEYSELEGNRNRMSKFIDGIELHQLYFFGITEMFEDDILELAQMLNWNSIQSARINDNSQFKAGMPVVTENEKKLIQDLNEKDMNLYRVALEMRKSRKH